MIEEILKKEMAQLKKGIPLQLGRITLNKTYRYLYPIVKLYGEETYQMIRSLYKLGVGINDVIYWQNNNIVLTHELFILIDTKGEYQHDRHVNPITAQMKFADDLLYLRTSGVLKTDYVFDDISGHMHMLVVKLPEDVPHAIRAMVLGKYNMIYSPEEANRLFKKDSVEYKVITDSSDYRVALSGVLEDRLGVKVSPDDLPGLTSKLNFEDEIFKNRTL